MDSLLKKEITADVGCLTPTRAKPEFDSLSPRWGPSNDTETATKVITEVAGHLVSAMADLSSKVDSHIKNSPKLGDHGDCNSSSLPQCQANTASPFYRPQASPKVFNGFSSSDVTSTAAPEDLLHYLRSKDYNTGVSSSVSVPGAHQYTGAPAPPAGSHVHHIYVDDEACLHEDGVDYAYQGRRSGVAGSGALSSSSEEEQIRVQEHRETVVTVGKKRTKGNGKPFGNKPKMQKKK